MFSKQIKDCIYGFVDVPKCCVPILNHPLFQRLRRIKQLGSVHFVFPGATHTRFEHSLGVMHLAGEAVDAIIAVGGSISAREKELVQIAGLTHDLGHLAYSHLMDKVLKEVPIDGVPPDHEDRSIELLKTINEDVGIMSDEELAIVAEMIHPTGKVSDRPYLFEIVSAGNSEFDVDRADYLHRDAYRTGLGAFQSDYLLRSIRIESGHIAFLPRATSELETMMFTRTRMYKTVYLHRSVRRVDEFYMHMLQLPKVTQALTDLVRRRGYACLDDFRLETIFEDNCPDELQKLYSRKY